MAESELERLDPEAAFVELASGLSVEVQRLKTRQFFRLLKILTHGAGPAMMSAGLDFSGDAEEFTRRMMTLVMFSIPDAEQETIGFLQSMAQPAGLKSRKLAKLSKQEQEDNDALWERFNEELFNPELDDMVSLLEVIVKQEAPELQALGKRLGALFNLAQQTGQDRPEKPDELPSQEEMAASSQAPSASPSTSSATSTGGQTSTSGTSPSAGSGNASRRRRTVATTSTLPV
jgi:hypothetical protein